MTSRGAVAANQSQGMGLGGIGHQNATCLGLHLKNIDNDLTQSQIDERARLRYSLYGREVAFAGVLGKPPLTSFEYTTVPFDNLRSGPIEDAPLTRDTIGTRRMWVDFLRRRRDAGQTMHRGQMSWQNFQCIG